MDLLLGNAMLLHHVWTHTIFEDGDIALLAFHIEVVERAILLVGEVHMLELKRSDLLGDDV